MKPYVEQASLPHRHPILEQRRMGIGRDGGEAGNDTLFRDGSNALTATAFAVAPIREKRI